MSNLTFLDLGNNTACRDERRLEKFSDVSRVITFRQKNNLQSLVLPKIDCPLFGENSGASKEVYGPLGETLLGMHSLRHIVFHIKPFALVFRD